MKDQSAEAGRLETLEVTALGGKGEGIARVDGKVVFIAGAVPGERVRVIRGNAPRGRAEHARLDEVLEPVPFRRDSPCPHDREGGCGGCRLLGFEAPDVAELKRRAWLERIERAGLDPAVCREVAVAGDGLAYRSRARFRVTRDGRLAYVRRERFGRKTSGAGRGLIPLDRCPILLPRVEALRKALDGKLEGASAAEIRASETTGEALVVLEAEGLPSGVDPVALDAALVVRNDGQLLPFRGFPWHHEEIAGERFRVGEASFFQINPAGAEWLVSKVRELVQVGPQDTALDLFAGVGLFAMTALRGAKRVVAVEAHAPGWEDLRHNASEAMRRARDSHAPCAEFSTLALPAGDVVQDLVATAEIPAVVVADPPRSGLGDALDALLALKAPRVVLVSCDPRAMVEDARQLVAGGYRMESAWPLDQFGGTHHLEVVTRFERDPAAG